MTRAITLHEGSPAHRAYVALGWLTLVAVIVYIPLAADLGSVPGSLDKAFRIEQINSAIAYAVAILGLTVVTGMSGQVSLGQSAFVGLGAYTTVVLVADHGWGYLATLPVAAALCFAAGLLVGIPATRVGGMYLAVVTLSVAAIFPIFVRRLDWLTGGVNGKGPPRGAARLDAPTWMPFADDRRLSRPLWVYCISVVVAALLFLLVRNLRRSRPGRALMAVRDNHTSAVAMGVDVSAHRAVAFAVSALCGGVAGSLLMMSRPLATDGMFDTEMSIFLFVSLVMGGVGAPSGALVGAFVYVFVPYYLGEWAIDQDGMPPVVRQVFGPVFADLRPTGGAPTIFFGLALVLVMFFAPGGFVAGARRLRERVVRVEPRRPTAAGPRG